MAREIQLEDLEDTDVGLYSPKGPVHAVKAVDITEDCVGLRRGVKVLVFFAPAEEGRLAAFRVVLPSEKYPGNGVSAFRLVEQSHGKFDDWAKYHLGLNETALTLLIVQLAPHFA